MEIWFKPLIDMKPADPTCIKTAIVMAVKETKSSGQAYTVFTADQQLYKVAVDVSWVYPDLFPKKTFTIRSGDMHLLMNFIGCVSKLMDNTGLEDVLSCAFGYVKKMLIGKYLTQNLRALRMLLEELMLTIFPDIDNFDELTVVFANQQTINPNKQLSSYYAMYGITAPAPYIYIYTSCCSSYTIYGIIRGELFVRISCLLM